MTTFNSELSKAMRALGAYFTKATHLFLRVENGALNVLVTLREGGSALAQIPCANEEPLTWKEVDATTLKDVVSLSDGEIAIDFGEDALTVKSGRSTSDLRYMDTGAFTPDEIKFGDAPSRIAGKDLALIAKMTEAASTEEARPVLQGLYVAADGKTLRVAAADGFILSFAEINAKAKAKGAIYSAKAINRVARAIKPDDEEEIAFGINADGIVFSAVRNGAVFTFDAPRMEGDFPDYMKIVEGARKNSAGVTVEIATRALENVLKRAKAINSNLYFQVLDGTLWFMAVNDGTEEKCLESFPINAAETPCMHMATSLLKDVAKACAANGKIDLTFPAANNAPMFFKGAATVLAMPLHNVLEESPFKGLQPSLL